MCVRRACAAARARGCCQGPRVKGTHPHHVPCAAQALQRAQALLQLVAPLLGKLVACAHERVHA